MIKFFRNKWVWVYLVVQFWSVSWTQTSANLDVLNNQLVNPILMALDSTIQSGDAVKIASDQDDEVSQWIKMRIRDELLKGNVTIYDDQQEISPVTSVALQNIFTQIYYKPVSRNFLFRINKYERHIESLLSFYIKDENESIIYSYSKIQQMSDTLVTDELDKVESKFHLFTLGKRLESGWVRKFFEPAIITVTTVGVIILFYSLRSG